MPGDDGESRRTPQHAGPDLITTAILAAQRRARSRIRVQGEHRRVCRQLEELVPLARFYGPRRPRPIPLGRFLVEGWRHDAA